MSRVSGWYREWDFYQPNEFIGQVLVSLWHKGIDTVEISREQIEDDMYTLVTIHRTEDYEKNAILIRWTLKGHPERAKPPLGSPPKIIEVEKRVEVVVKQPFMLQPYFLVPTFTVLGMVLGFLMGAI